MRVPLVDFSPRWLAEPGRARQGISFLCPGCGNHRLECWFSVPRDGLGSVTAHEGLELVDVSGSTFDDLSLLTHSLECGAEWMFLKRGHVVLG